MLKLVLKEIGELRRNTSMLQVNERSAAQGDQKNEISDDKLTSPSNGSRRDGFALGDHVKLSEICRTLPVPLYAGQAEPSWGPLEKDVVGEIVQIDLSVDDREPFKVRASGLEWWYELSHITKVEAENP